MPATAKSNTEAFRVGEKCYFLERLPFRKNDLLRGWNSADQLLADCALASGETTALIVNDEHGAVSLALNGLKASVWIDSFISWQACQHNFNKNKIGNLPTLYWSSQIPLEEYSLVVLRLPKQLAMLEHQLISLKPQLSAGAIVLTAGMDKHTPPEVARLLSEIIGSTERKPGVKKAHLFVSHNDHNWSGASPYPSSYYCEALNADLISHANVFSRDQLDIGARLMLESFTQLPSADSVVDLACGNGVLGIAAARQLRPGTLTLLDESHMAVSSAETNARALLDGLSIDIRVNHGDGFQLYEGHKPELILCNPPFHHNFVVDEYVGQRLISDAASRLEAGGKLWLVANRHLPYRKQLRSLFAAVREVAGNGKFVIFEGSK